MGTEFLKCQIENIIQRCSMLSWYIEHLIHGILNPLPMVYRTSFPWYFEPPAHSISNPLSMVYQTPYLWYFEPPIHGILNPLPMVYQTPYPWYIEPPIHLLIRNEGAQNTRGVQFTIQGGGGQFSIRRFNIPWKKINPGSIYHGVQNII